MARERRNYTKELGKIYRATFDFNTKINRTNPKSNWNSARKRKQV